MWYALEQLLWDTHPGTSPPTSPSSQGNQEREREGSPGDVDFFFNFKRNMNYYLPLSHDLVSSACFLFPLLLSLEESQ